MLGDVAVEWVAVGQDPREGEEEAGHADPGITDDGTEGPEPAEGQGRVRDQGVGEQHPQQDDVQEEALRPALAVREIAMFQVGGDDAGVVGPVPIGGAWLGDELHPPPDRDLRPQVVLERVAQRVLGGHGPAQRQEDASRP